MAALSNIQRAALVILSLEEVVSASLLSQLEEDELRRLADAVDALDDIPYETVIGVLEEFERELNAPMVVGNRGKYMYKLAASAIGEERAERLFSDKHEVPTAIDSIAAARSSAVAEVLQEEHPQVAAAILSRFPARKAADVIAYMEDDYQVDIMGRLATVELVAERTIDGAADALLASLAEVGGTSADGERPEFDGVQYAASLLNEMDPAESEKILDLLDQESGETAESIRAAMFVFDDLVKLDERALQLLMREISSDELVTALHTASEEIRAALLGAVSSRAAQTIEEDLEMSSPRRLSEVEAAQREVVDTAMRMAADGRIMMPSRGEEMV